MNEDETPRPPYSADMLADLHAGVLDADLSARMWPLVRADPRAVAVLEQLDAVQAQLSGLRWDEPAESIPSDVAARLDAAVQNEQRRPSRRWPSVVGVAAAAIIAATFALVLLDSAPGGDPAGHDPVAMSPSDALFEPAALRSVVGTTSLGPLAQADTLRECLNANGFDPGQPLLGAREVEFRERDAVLLLLGGPLPLELTAVVVGTDCNAHNPATLAIRSIG